jgi:hypothetical protein
MHGTWPWRESSAIPDYLRLDDLDSAKQLSFPHQVKLPKAMTQWSPV